FQTLDPGEITELELGHAAAGLLLDQGVGDLVVLEDCEQIVAYPRLVVVHVASREYSRLPRGERSVPHFALLDRRRMHAERARAVRRQATLMMHADRLLHHRAGGGVAVDRVDDLRHNRNRGELPDRVGRGKQLVPEANLLFLKLDRLGAQHEMREIDVPGMRRHVRTLGHVAHVAQVALVHHLPEVLLGHTVDLQRRARVDEVEQRRKRGAEIDAAPAAVTYAEDALELGGEPRFVVEIRRAPSDGVPGRSFEAPWAEGRGGAPPAAAPAPGLGSLHGALGRREQVASRPGRREPSGTGWRASAPPSRAFRTSRRSPQSLPGAPPWPCPGTCRCIRGSRPRSRPSDWLESFRKAGRSPGRRTAQGTRGVHAHARSRLRRSTGTPLRYRFAPRRPPWQRNTDIGGWPATLLRTPP